MNLNKQLPVKILFSFLLLFCRISLNAQMLLQDSLLYNQTQNQVIALYKNAIKENLRLYNGSEYVNNNHGIKGFPYFKSADILRGSVFYDGNLYNDVAMQYDIATDELIIQDYTKNYPVKLIAEKIKYFIIDSSTFINAKMKDISPFADETGFYEEIYSGKTIVFAKKKKVISTKTSSEGFTDAYKQYNNYFIYNNEKIYKVNNEKAVFNVFKRKNELRKFINSNNINFKKDFENALVKTAQYFDQLKN